MERWTTTPEETWQGIALDSEALNDGTLGTGNQELTAETSTASLTAGFTVNAKGADQKDLVLGSELAKQPSNSTTLHFNTHFHVCILVSIMKIICI